MEGRSPSASPPSPRGLRGRLARASFVCGSLGLLLAMAFDVIAVVGRQLGTPLLGSIELIQACVVLAASSALAGATLGSAHATVHVLTERLRPALRHGIARAADLLSALFFAWLTAGSVWVAAELWSGREATELLNLPIAPLRWFFCASTLLVTGLFAANALRRRAGRP